MASPHEKEEEGGASFRHTPVSRAVKDAGGAAERTKFLDSGSIPIICMNPQTLYSGTLMKCYALRYEN